MVRSARATRMPQTEVAMRRFRRLIMPSALTPTLGARRTIVGAGARSIGRTALVCRRARWFIRFSQVLCGVIEARGPVSDGA